MRLDNWCADFTDPLDFQHAVLDWLARLGVEDPINQRIERVRLTAQGDGHAVLTCFELPLRKGPDGYLARIDLWVPLTEMPPPRPDHLRRLAQNCPN